MNTAERRGEILKILHNADAPVAARELAGKFGIKPVFWLRFSHGKHVPEYIHPVLFSFAGSPAEFPVLS